MSVQSSPMLVLSYNICYQAMCHDGHGSAAQLGMSCTWSSVNNMTICALNIARMIDGTPGAAGSANYDFVGLQEANYADELALQATNTLAHMQKITSKATGTPNAKGAKMASFYNQNKYTLVESFCGVFSSKNLERPFHILLLNDKATSDSILFINVHTPHGKDVNTHTNVPYRDFDAVAYDLSQAASGMKSFDASKSYTIIMTGDFNETGWNWGNNDLIPKQWSPLHFAGLATKVAISNVVFSCSQDNGCWEKADGMRGGDYIFSSLTPATISVPQNYVFAPQGACGDINIMKTIWQSDHLPVTASIS
jgi:exonuclease III